jgi:hypothetical protein
LLLCSCPFEEEAEHETSLLLDSSSDLYNSSSSIVVMPSSSSVEPTEPSILDCPPEDIAEYPVSEHRPYPEDRSPDDRLDGWWPALKLSVEELSFGWQGGVRCITASQGIVQAIGYIELGCHDENAIVSDTVNYTHFNVTSFKRVVCPWFIATRLDDRRILHISVNKNETREEREMRIIVSAGDTGAGLKITQSPN